MLGVPFCSGEPQHCLLFSPDPSPQCFVVESISASIDTHRGVQTQLSPRRFSKNGVWGRLCVFLRAAHSLGTILKELGTPEVQPLLQGRGV